MKSRNLLFVSLLSLSILLAWCSNQTQTTNTEDSVNTGAVSQNTATTEKLIDSNEDGSVKVFQLTSSSVAYDGEHGIGRRWHHTDYLTTTLSVNTDGVVTAISNQHEASSPKSRSYQSRFDAAIESQIVGKKLSDVSLWIIWWASTTSEAFDEALKQIKTQFNQS